MHSENVKTESATSFTRNELTDKRFHSEFKLAFRQLPVRHAHTLHKGIPAYESYYQESVSFLKERKQNLEETPFSRVNAKKKSSPKSKGLQWLNHPKLKQYRVDFNNLLDAGPLETNCFSQEVRCFTPNQISTIDDELSANLKPRNTQPRAEKPKIIALIPPEVDDHPHKSRSQSKMTRTQEFVFRCEKRAQLRRQNHENCCHQNEENCRFSKDNKTKKDGVNCYNQKVSVVKEKARGRRRRSSV